MKHGSKSMSCALAGALFVAAGCGGAATKTDKTTPGSTETTASGADAAVEVSIPIIGERYVPDALGRPGMPLVEGKKKLPVDKQRAAIEKTKDPEDLEVLSQVLATTLYQAAKAEKDPAKQSAGIDDARTVLKQAVEKNGGKAVDENTLKMLGTIAFIKADYAAAEQAWSDLVKLKPKAADINESRTWWGHALLLQNKNAAAVAAMSELAPTPTAPEAAYITAWAKFRTGDMAGAFQAIGAANKGWKEPSSKGAVASDYMLFATYANASLDESIAAVVAAIGKESEAPALINLSRLLHSAGRYTDAIAAVEKVLAGGKITKIEVPTLRVQQMVSALTADMPKESAAFGKQALDALAACGADCSKNLEAIRMQVRNTAQRFHSNYATSQDDRFYQPARDMYAAVAQAGDGSADLASQAKGIDTVKANVAAGKLQSKGIHDKSVVIDTMQLHQFEVKTCYEAVLAGAPAVGGGVALTLEFDMKGAVTGATTNPAAGVADLSAVASCVVEHARTWRLPARGTPGVTRATIKFELSSKK
jgi:tetratricopeptide (TPR) repeat protein